MEGIVWSPSMSVGIEDIDTQHKILISIANDLNIAMHEHRTNEVLDETLERLMRYTERHFEFEEALMAQYGYPDLVEHRGKHNQLLADVLAVKTRYASGENIYSAELMRFLGNWIRTHIMASDKAFGKYVAASGG